MTMETTVAAARIKCSGPSVIVLAFARCSETRIIFIVSSRQILVPPQKIGALLGAGELRALSRKARRLMELQQVFLDSAPSSLSRASRVQDYQTGILFLSAENAAVATKLRQLAPSLLLKIRKRDAEVTGIKIAVQVKEITETPQNTPEK